MSSRKKEAHKKREQAKAQSTIQQPSTVQDSQIPAPSMKFHALSLIWALTAPSNVNAQATYVCPSAGSISLPISPADGVTTIRLPRVSPSDALCLLTRRNAATGGERVTASRSYAGRDWERSAGTLAKTGSGVVVDCTQGSATECDVTLPALDQGFEYILESHTYGISEEAEATRFLEQVSFGSEMAGNKSFQTSTQSIQLTMLYHCICYRYFQATFGATRETIDAMTASSNDFASWVEDQLALPVGSHREFYRSHTNPKFEFAYKVGATGPRPCELHSRWRRYAITSLDQLSNRKTGWNKHLTIELKNGKYLWKVDDQLRTVTATLPIGHDQRPLELDLRYKITFTNRHGGAWNSDCIGKIHSYSISLYDRHAWPLLNLTSLCLSVTNLNYNYRMPSLSEGNLWID